MESLVRQVMHAEHISYARCLPIDLAAFCQRLSTAKPRYGPDPDRPLLYWCGEPHPLATRTWQFLRTIWSKHNVPFAEIAEGLWTNDDMSGNAIRQLISRVNHDLNRQRIPFLFFPGRNVCLRPKSGQGRKLLRPA